MPLPDYTHHPWWWPLAQFFCRARIQLGAVGEKGIIMHPTKQGYVPQGKGLPYNLFAYRLAFAN
jgi:hypothetical protein